MITFTKPVFPFKDSIHLSAPIAGTCHFATILCTGNTRVYLNERDCVLVKQENFLRKPIMKSFDEFQSQSSLQSLQNNAEVHVGTPNKVF